MQGKMMLSVLVGQEKRAVILFLILLLSIFLITDILFTNFYNDGSGTMLLFPYVVLYLLLPLAVYFVKIQSPGHIKYTFFLAYMITAFITEIIIFWGNPDYQAGNVAEVFFVLFSPIFINKRYFFLVSVTVLMKYFLIGLLLKTMVVLLPTILMFVLSLIAFIILNRFIGYMDAINKSYSKQIETAVSSGTAIINHTMKNEITKIQYLNNRLKELKPNGELEKLDSIMESIDSSTDHMLNMSSRLREKTEEVVLHENQHHLNSILYAAVASIEPYLEKNRIQCSIKMEYEIELLCDQVQLQEVISNLMMNAIEAMERDGGVLSIRVLKVKKDLVIQIEDTGHGIPIDIRSRVFEPFFTTKNSPENYGLGLSYCHNVIQKHGGTLAIHSEEGIGTVVAIRYPRRRVVRLRKLDKNEIKVSIEQDRVVG